MGEVRPPGKTARSSTTHPTFRWRTPTAKADHRSASQTTALMAGAPSAVGKTGNTTMINNPKKLMLARAPSSNYSSTESPKMKSNKSK